MIEGAAWRRWVFYNIPLILFVFVLLFPFYWMIITTFRPDGELYRPWNAPNYMPFWTNHPTLEHIEYLFEETNFARWMLNTMFIAVVSTLISLFCGVLAGYALVADPDLSDVPDPVLYLADDGLFQGHPEGARGMRAHRRRLALEGDGLHHHSLCGARHPVSRHHRLHPVVERIHLRPRLPVFAGPEDRARGRHLGVDPRRRLLLGAADGGRAAGLDPGGDRLFVLRRTLCFRPYRLGQRIASWPRSSSASSTRSST